MKPKYVDAYGILSDIEIEREKFVGRKLRFVLVFTSILTTLT